MNYVYVCVSLCIWRELMCAWNLLRWSLKGNSTRLLPILVATCAAFCTRIWDRSSRGHRLPLATQAMFVFLVGINNLLDLIWLNVTGYNQGLLGSAFCSLRKLVYAIKLCSWIASVNLTWEDRHVPQSLTRKMSEIWARKISIWQHKTKCNWVRTCDFTCWNLRCFVARNGNEDKMLGSRICPYPAPGEDFC